MDNNKIVDNLNFIKIYFRVFTYKIIVLKKPKLSRKEIKNHRWRMKTRLGVRTGQKTLKGESEMHLNTEVRSVSKSPFGPLKGLKGPNFPFLGFGPMAFG